MYQEVEFPSERAILRGRLYKRKGCSVNRTGFAGGFNS